MRIAEGVDGAARSIHPVSRFKVACLVIDRIAQRSFEDIDDLFIVLMAVRRRNARACLHRQLEHADSGTRHGSVLQIADFELSDLHYWLFLRLHASSPCESRAFSADIPQP